MLEKSPREEKLGCLFGLVGGLIGFLAGGSHFEGNAQQLRAADPEVTLCGLPAVAAMFGGLFLGGLLGTLFGMILSRLLPSSKPHDSEVRRNS